MPAGGGGGGGGGNVRGGVRQRAVLYPHSRRVGAGDPSGGGGGGGTSLPVPNWFDLPVLLPETHAVAARMQSRVMRGDKAGGAEQVSDPDGGAPRGRFAVPSVSRLNAVPASPVVPLKGPMAVLRARSSVLSPVPRTDASGRLHLRRRNSARRLDGLPGDRRSRLRAKLWRDLDRFGLWHLVDDDDGAGTVDQTIDSIMAQWQRSEAKAVEPGDDQQLDELRSDGLGVGCSREASLDESVFLTALPASLPQDPGSIRSSHLVHEDVSSPELRSLASTGSMTSVDPELGMDARTNDDERDEGSTPDDHRDYVSGPKLTGGISLPGMKRRQRLKDLHQFVETQLQKRLLKSWDTIEVAFTGSGEMTISQIVKFLQHSDVQLGEADAAKVQAILEQQVALQDAGEEQQHASSSSLAAVSEANEDGAGDPTQGSNNASARGPPGKPDRKKTLFSYDGFRQIFRSRNAQQESRWKREFDRERSRKKQEKEIYDRELAALEERGG